MEAEKLIEALESFSLCRLSKEKAVGAMNVAYNIFRDESNYDCSVRCAAAERILLTLLKCCTEISLKEFFVEHIRDIMSLVEARETKVGVACSLQCNLLYTCQVYYTPPPTEQW